MWQCWQQDPQSRATFLELGKTLHRLMTAQTVSDQSLLSPYSITISANTQVMRIKEMVIKHEMS